MRFADMRPEVKVVDPNEPRLVGDAQALAKLLALAAVPAPQFRRHKSNRARLAQTWSRRQVIHPLVELWDVFKQRPGLPKGANLHTRGWKSAKKRWRRAEADRCALAVNR